jgi:hypothetical protein
MRIVFCILFASILALSACQVSRVTKDKTTTKTTEETVVSKETVSVSIPEKKFEIGEKIPVFQPIRFVSVQNGETKIVHEYVFSGKSKDSSAYWNGKIDSLGVLSIEFKTLAQEYQAQVEVQNKIIREQTERVITLEKQQTWFGRTINNILWAFGILIIILIALGVLYLKFKRAIFL